MRFDVLLADKAACDLESIRNYVAAADSAAAADRVLDTLLDVIVTLEKFPERGSHPRELLALGHIEYRQIVRKPWRVFYRVGGKQVHIVLIADGRRDLRSLLTQRLLGA